MFRGIETQALTEFAGEFGSGKSQLCHTLSVTANMPKEKGGLGGNVIFIDTENTFRPERIRILEKILSSIFVCKIYNSSHLEFIIKNLADLSKNLRTSLVIIDSVSLASSFGIFWERNTVGSTKKDSTRCCTD